MVKEFEATIQIIGVNPFVFVPEDILLLLFGIHGKDKGPIPIRGELNNKAYQQTLVKYKGDWRLYINTSMLKHSPERIGEKIKISISYDASDRSIKAHPLLVQALKENPRAGKKFESLPPSLQKEIVRYISFLKAEESIRRNVARAIRFLLGKEGFIGRKPLK